MPSGNIRQSLTVEQILADYPELADELARLPARQPIRNKRDKRFGKKYGDAMNGDLRPRRLGPIGD